MFCVKTKSISENLRNNVYLDSTDIFFYVLMDKLVHNISFTNESI